MRIETDFLGSCEIPSEAFYGIHSKRARDNFPNHIPFPIQWFKGLAYVKKACYLTCLQFNKAVRDKFEPNEIKVRLIKDEVLHALIEASDRMIEGKYFEHFVVPAISGGAGTSINMNINEIIANVALLICGKELGNYSYIDPIEHANINQSTNDVIPTSLKISLMFQFKDIENDINRLRSQTERLEKEYGSALRMGYTEMQEAVPTTFGRLFSSYSDALSRDWWRVSKCLERLKAVNLGGGAIGTGLTIPTFFIMHVVQNLQQITHLPVTRAENLADATYNFDVLVEVHAIIKSCAVNLEKMVSDLRLLASDLLLEPMVSLPQLQAGSSIMPSKVNPVIPEYVISAAHRIYANDLLVTNLAGQGCLELNAYLPVIGCSMIESLHLLSTMLNSITDHLLSQLKVRSDVSYHRLINSPSITTALIPYVGYHKATELALFMRTNKKDVFTANQVLKIIDPMRLEQLLRPEQLLRLGYSVKDMK